MMEEYESIGIQPCCIHKQLPSLLKKGGNGSFFFSNGDWGLQKLWFAASCLVESTLTNGSEEGNYGEDIFTLITLPTVDVYTLRYLRNSLERHFIHALVLIIADKGKEDMVRTELDGLLERVWFMEDRDEAKDSNLWIRSSSTEKGQSLVIAGPIPIEDTGNGRFCQYFASYTTYDIRARQAFEPYRLRLRQHAKITGSDPLFGKWGLSVNKKLKTKN